MMPKPRVVKPKPSVYAESEKPDAPPSHAVHATLLTIEQRFSQLRAAYQAGAPRIEVSYDERYGYPTAVFIDYDELIADEELSYTISELQLTHQ